MRCCRSQHNFKCIEFFTQTRRRIFNFTGIQVLYFSRRNLETVDIARVLLPLTVAKLSTVKSSPVFSNFIHHQVIEKKKTNENQYTINTKIQSVR